MSNKDYKIEFEGGAAAQARQGASLLEAASDASLEVSADCGGAGTCGKCRARVSGKFEPPTALEKRRLSADEFSSGVRLACQAKLAGDARAAFEGNAVSSEISQFSMEYVPTTVYEIEPTIPVSHLNEKNAEPFFGVALDVGTTTMNARLVDLRTGKVSASAASANPQRIYGADVASRLSFASAGGLATMKRRVSRRAAAMFEWLAASASASVSVDSIQHVTLVGNPTMLSIFMGFDPAGIGAAPFTPPFTGAAVADARELGLPVAKGAKAETLPVVSGYVGADAAAAAMRAGLWRPGGARLMIDLGTNAEMVLAVDGRIWASAAAAGPAFEGAHISCGMTAREGAVEGAVLADGHVNVRIIGSARPAGFCGTGLIDIIAALLDAGALAESGRLRPFPAGSPQELAARLEPGERGAAGFTAVRAGECGAACDLVVTQRDIREVQLAKGAILAGAETLMDRAGVSADALETVYLAGALGTYLNPRSALRIGLLPHVEPQRVKFIGNAALDGAVDVLLFARARSEVFFLGSNIEYFELSSAPCFADKFAAAMSFPSE